MADESGDWVCRFCGLIIRQADHVVEVMSFAPPVVHVACAEAAHVAPGEWTHTDARTLSEWSRGIAWGSSA